MSITRFSLVAENLEVIGNIFKIFNIPYNYFVCDVYFIEGYPRPTTKFYSYNDNSAVLVAYTTSWGDINAIYGYKYNLYEVHY